MCTIDLLIGFRYGFCATSVLLDSLLVLVVGLYVSLCMPFFDA